jgi:hypothetical protein
MESENYFINTYSDPGLPPAGNPSAVVPNATGGMA